MTANRSLWPARALGPLALVALAVLWIGGKPASPSGGSSPHEGHEEDRGFFGFTFDMETEGVRVRSIVPGGAAEAASLRPGDLVLSLGDRALAGLTHLQMHDLVAPYRVGDRVPLEVAREDRVFSVTLTLGPTPPEYRTSSEAQARFHAALFENEGLEQFFGLVRRSSVLVLRRGEDGEYFIRPDADGAEWEPLHPFLVPYLDRYLDDAVSKLRSSKTLRVSAVREGSGVRLKLLPGS